MVADPYRLRLCAYDVVCEAHVAAKGPQQRLQTPPRSR